MILRRWGLCSWLLRESGGCLARESATFKRPVWHHCNIAVAPQSSKVSMGASGGFNEAAAFPHV
jgi:hypothetical protein